ncbi:DUF1761 domain-containing protein [Frigidibacter sp. RF13]|uniref:DUF1761 domain-containing protein n=1 Tax=Frigidibacter sp. RF13 TaxID=2997340 RepID=UPI002271EA56|nr:DUF1761 domain-containing protein [Frigidibacter sp. RF13]MCY1126468.1 DUF1761 domain-containing protein [Frigidibacter sp. RF13]
MELLNVLAAALGAYVFGAVWYMSLSKAWMAASGVAVGADGRPANGSNPMPYVTGFLAMVVVAGMMRHIFSMAGIDTVGKGIVAGLGIGAFFVMPFLAMNYAFAMRNSKLTLIDGANATFACAIMGAILMLF